MRVVSWTGPSTSSGTGSGAPRTWRIVRGCDLVDREGRQIREDTATVTAGRAGLAPSSVVTVIVTSEKPV
ncbi:MAG TPA: hypothetical protein VHZ81_11205 [Galbitalea sp.]|nr:hypothetical protein [Galbitalea sp.]